MRVPQLQRGIEIPVILLASDDAPPGERVQARRAGADSVFVEPIQIDEVVARVDTLMEHRRTHQVRRVHDVIIDLDAHVVRRNDVELQLTATEFKLLTVLAQRRGRVQSREQLLHDVWEYDNLIDTRTVDTHMRRLREKLGLAAKYLDTVRGVGYRFVEE